LSQRDTPHFEPVRRQPVHVVYGGAHLFKSDTPNKLGRIALRSLNEYAPDFAEFARAMWLREADTLPIYPDVVLELDARLRENADAVKAENHPAWFAWTIYQKTIAKLETEAVEDIRIDFEDGYGFRSDDEEDGHAVSASTELAKAFDGKTLPPFCGFRIKSFAPETYHRAVRTLDIFMSNLLEQIGGQLPDNFVIALPKVNHADEVAALAKLLADIEKHSGLDNGSLKLEILIETPHAIVDADGRIALSGLVEAACGRCVAAHLGAYDYTASYGIAAAHQHLRHDALIFARNFMQTALAPTGIRLSDSVTTRMPVAVHRGEELTADQIKENKRTVHTAWRAHFNNVTHSLIDGFYQSWDLHPAQLVARYAAVYAFFLESADASGKRMRGFMDKATQAMLTGNQFDDVASAEGLLNFFVRALNCRAMALEEITSTTGLTAEELQLASFAKIMEKRNYKSAVS
jgi:citrate lyase beta subunit